MKEKIIRILEDSIAVKQKIMQSDVGKIIALANTVVESLRKGGKVIIFGNGGSAADSQHIAAEFVGRFKIDRQALPAVALTVNTSVLTAIGNDYGFEFVFSKQIEALGRPEDIVIGISTSGKAKNVLEGIRKAKSLGIKTIAFTGGDGGPLAKESDIAYVAPSDVTARIQEAHITIGHILCELAEEQLTES
ncbi:SIS domain-containing protein [Candidatus Omnitrophota bacterium]